MALAARLSASAPLPCGGMDSIGGAETLQLLMLAFGAALLIGNLAALAKPPSKTPAGQLRRAPKWRTIAMALVGLAIAVWALASIGTNPTTTIVGR